MVSSGTRFADAFLRYAAPLGKLRGIPLLGNLVELTSRAFGSSSILNPAQIKSGPAAGLWIYPHPDSREPILWSEKEPDVQQAFADHLHVGMTVYDLGAHVGFFSLMAAHLVGSEGHVFAFEPDPALFPHLCQNLNHNGFRHVTAEECAVWSESATVPFARPSATESCGAGRISTNAADTPNTIRVGSVSLDDYCTSHPAPDFIKCDVAGAEFEVFEGATSTLRQWRPTIICRMHSTENRYSLTRFFLDFGYTCYALGPSHVLALLE